MKSNVFFLLAAVLGLSLSTGCNSSVNADQLLKDENLRTQIFNQIVGDHDLMMRFMEVAMKNDHAKSMMMNNGGGMEGAEMMDAGKMIQMMQRKPEMKHGMMMEMMKDGEMMGHMMQMMHQEGMMSKECMESCMQMMKAKGMDIGSEVMEGSHDSHEH